MTDQLNSASAVTGTDTASRTLVIERVFRAPPDRVFRAWTDPIELAKWWGPEGLTAPEVDLDVRDGGAWRTVMEAPDGQRMTVSGVFREIRPPERLVMTWGWIGEDGERGHETEIEVTFEGVPEGTKLRLVQRVFDSVEQRNFHNEGWMSTFNDLDKVFG